MVTEDRVMTLYSETNPVPSTADLDLVVAGAAEYLATLDARSSEVTQLKTKPTEPKGQSRSTMTWLVAAVLIVVAGVAALLIATGGEADVDDAPASPVEPVATTVAEETQPVVEASVLAGIPEWFDQGAGQYTASRSEVPYAFTVPAGWNAGGQTEDRLTLCSPNEFNDCVLRPAAIVSILRLDVGSVDETRQYLATLDGAELGAAEEVVIGGAEGIRFELTHEVPMNIGGQVQPDLEVPVVAVSEQNEQIPIGYGPLGRSIITVVDVNGVTMTLSYQGEDPSRGAVSDGFEPHLEEGMSIVNSIIWGDLAGSLE